MQSAFGVEHISKGFLKNYKDVIVRGGPKLKDGAALTNQNIQHARQMRPRTGAPVGPKSKLPPSASGPSGPKR